jgi:hypothetical protein
MLLSQSPEFFYLFLLPLGILVWGAVLWILSMFVYLIKDNLRDN